MDRKSYFEQWCKKLGMKIEDMEKEYQAVLTEEKEIHKDLPIEQQEQRALLRVSMNYKKQLKSPAVTFEGVVVGVGDAFDAVKKQRQTAEDMYTGNMEKAIREGVTDSEGRPLDTRRTWSGGRENNNFGKPLPEHSWVRTVYVIATKSGETATPRFGVLSMNGDVAKVEGIPVFVPVKFKAIDKTKQGEVVMRMNSSLFTKFERDDSVQLPAIPQVLRTFMPDSVASIEDLDMWHEANKDNMNRLVVVEGDADTINLEPTAFGSKLLVLTDASKTLDIEADSPRVTCWVPGRMKIDFGMQSRIIVLGRTTRGAKRMEDGSWDKNQPGDILINVCSIYVYPEFKLPAITELKKEDLEAKEEKEEEVDEDEF